MNKFTAFLLIILTIALTFGLGFGYKKVMEPNTYYKVYYKGKNLGVISSSDELNDYINENGKVYKNKYKIDAVYAPNGVQVKKLVTYNGKVDSVKKVYDKIEKEEEFTADLKSCGDNCYQDNISTDILQAYHKFFYVYATVLPVSEILIQNPAADENISYYIQNKLVNYTWENKNHLVITIDDEKLEFKKQKNSIRITTTLQVLKNYILN